MLLDSDLYFAAKLGGRRSAALPPRPGLPPTTVGYRPSGQDRLRNLLDGTNGGARASGFAWHGL